MKTEWGVTIGVKRVPEPVLVIGKNGCAYGWKIDRHGIIVYGNTKQQCRDEFRSAYNDETGGAL